MYAVRLISYADNKHALYDESKKRLFKEASDFNEFSKIKIYGYDDLTGEFKTKFQNTLEEIRGAGYWIWKFYIIEQELSDMNDEDYLIYVDCGCTINIKGKQRFFEYLDKLKSSHYGMISFLQNGNYEKQFTIDELYKEFHLPKTNEQQINASILIMKKCDHLFLILNNCMNILKNNQRLITDDYNSTNKAKNPRFIENRHDQSFFDLATKKHKAIFIQDEGTKNRFPLAPFWTTRIKKNNIIKS